MKTENLQLTYVLSGQAQKHVSVNETFRQLDILVHLTALSRMVDSAPSAPLPGQRYILPATAEETWGEPNAILTWQDGIWHSTIPQEGFVCWIVDEAVLVIFTNESWQKINQENNQLSLLGIHTTADTVNRLAVNSPATLFDGEIGGHTLKINKQEEQQTASVIFQQAYNGYAEIGLTGDNSLNIKVSDDGLVWQTALIAAANTAVDLPSGLTTPQVEAANINTTQLNGGPLGGFRNHIINGDFQIAQRGTVQITSGTQSMDLWSVNPSGSSNFIFERMEFDLGQTAVPGNPVYYAHLETFVNENNVGLLYPIENVGTLAGQRVTFSCYARGNSSEQLNFKVYQVFGSGGSSTVVKFAKIDVTSQWQYKSVTLDLPSISNKILGDNHFVMVEISNPTTETWYMDIADVQLEQGSTPTAFERRHVALELAFCRRYFRKYHSAQNIQDLGEVMKQVPEESQINQKFYYSADIL